jgi:hypothetical protein
MRMRASWCREVSVVLVYIFAEKILPRDVERDHIKSRYETVKHTEYTTPRVEHTRTRY